MKRTWLRPALCVCALTGLAAPGAPAPARAAGPEDYTLTITGWCPGQITLVWRNATPGRRQAFVGGSEEGKTIIPSGRCAGTVIGIAERGAFVANILPTGDGYGKIRANMGPGRCRVPVQLVELPSCRTSNVARTP